MLRRSSKSYHSLEESRDSNGDLDVYGNSNDLYLSDGDKGYYQDEDMFEGNAFGKHLTDGVEKQDVRVPKQRLLVVANRLPVSAIRKDDDSWGLEISVGGLVSALLGKNWMIECSDVSRVLVGCLCSISFRVVLILELILFRLEGINEFEARWIGWAGVNVPDEVGQRSLTKALAEKVRWLDVFCKNYCVD